MKNSSLKVGMLAGVGWWKDACGRYAQQAVWTAPLVGECNLELKANVTVVKAETSSYVADASALAVGRSKAALPMYGRAQYS